MKFQPITLAETYHGYPYLLITYPTWSLEKSKIYYAVRETRRNGFTRFREYVDGVFLKNRLLWRNNFDIYTIIPFHESRLLNQLLRGITGDPSFYCDVLDHDVYHVLKRRI
jgi:hypothetical protein